MVVSDSGAPGSAGAAASVVIPAHNEADGIGALVSALTGPGARQLDILIICNGCTDDTATRARLAGGDAVRVVETTVASKANAIRLGDAATDVFPRLYLDADVLVSRRDVETILDALSVGALAAAPRRCLDTSRSSLGVRMFYAVWQELPQVRGSLFGRGVIAVSREGHRRLAKLPPMLADDLVAAAAFDASERCIVDDAEVVIRAPRTWRGLLRRRVRVAVGTTQAARAGAIGDDVRTSRMDLLNIVRSRPSSVPAVAVFASTAAIARLKARRQIARGDFVTWQRDDSVRSA